MSVADRAANLLQARLSWPQAHGCVDDLAAAGLLVTDDELELRTILAEAEQPDMQALADEAMRHVDAVNRIVEAAKAMEAYWNTSDGCDCAACLTVAAVRALREDEA